MESGIVRRIDELGRIVIPKEMRRTMRLNVGDEMEISSDGEALTLRPYGGLQNATSTLKAVGRVLCKATDGDVIFISANSIDVVEGRNKKEYESAHITESFSRLLRDRKNVVLHGEELDYIFEDRKCRGAFALVRPIVKCGDLIGACLLILPSLPSDVARAYLDFCVELIEASLG